MGYDATDSSGTDDDLPPNHLNRGTRGVHASVNAKNAVKGCVQYSKTPNDMEIQIHRLEQEAYSSVLRAFKAQSDAITWEKESLITELRKELRVSDKEHRELLAAVNADDIIQRIRDWRQARRAQSGLLDNVQPVHDQAPSPVSTSHKKQKTSHPVPTLSLGAPSPGPNSQAVVAAAQPLSSPAKRVAPPGIRGKKATSGQSLPRVHSMKSVQYSSNGPVERGQIVNQDPPNAPAAVEAAKAVPADALIGRRVLTRWPEDNSFYEAIITRYNPVEDRHALVYDINTENETWEWVNLRQFSPSDIRWDGEDPGISRRAGHGGPGNGTKKLVDRGGAVSGAGRGRGSLKNQPKDGFPSLQNGSQNHGSNDIEILNTDILIKEVQRIVGSSHPDPVEVEKAKKLLKVQEQSLINALERIADSSDGESGGKEHQLVHGQSVDLERGWKRRQHPGRHHASNYS